MADPADGRRILIGLTDRARQIREDVVITQSLNERATADMRDVELDEVLAAVRQMIRNLEAAPRGRA